MLLLACALAAAAEPAVEPTWYRVDDPDYPGAVARSAYGATLAAPPPPGVKYRTEPLASLDPVAEDDAEADAQFGAGAASWPVSDALAATNADLWHARGITGAGLKVAVFDLSWFGGDADLDVLGDYDTHDCFVGPSCDAPMVLVQQEFAFEGGVHGFACAQTLREMVPDAQLSLVRVNSLTTFENAVDWAIREHVDVITMSMSFYNGSFYDGTGPFADRVADLVANDVLLVSSSGNNARGHWWGPWGDGDQNDRQDFDGTNALWAYLDGTESSTWYLNWNQWDRCGETDLDAILYDPDGNIAGRGAKVQTPGADDCESFERFTADTTGKPGFYRFEVVRRRGATTSLVLDVLHKDARFDGTMPEASLTDPGSAPGTFAVGAVDVSGYLDNPIEGFSSWGPSHVGVAKPEIAGPDGTSVFVYGANGFFGTSASTPNVAGLVALVMSEDPSLTPAEAGARLQGWAWGEQPGFEQPDYAFGAGKARLPDLDAPPNGCGRQRLRMSVVFLLPWLWRRRRPRAR